MSIATVEYNQTELLALPRYLIPTAVGAQVTKGLQATIEITED
jgi:hypothetical protein